MSKDYDVDENGFEVLPDEPSVSVKTGKRKKANPTVLTQGKVNRICKLIEEGNFVKQSCIAVGVNYNTFMSIIRKGKKGIRPYDEWYNQIEQAKALDETRKVSTLNEQMEAGNVGVIQWYLARKYPNRWERSQKIEAKVDNSQKIEIVKYSDKQDKD